MPTSDRPAKRLGARHFHAWLGAPRAHDELLWKLQVRRSRSLCRRIGFGPLKTRRQVP